MAFLFNLYGKLDLLTIFNRGNFVDKLKRYELINQLLILEKLYPEDADYYSKNRKALENGYELHYSWLTENISDGLSEKQ